MILTEEEDEDFLVEEGPQIERGTVFLRDTCHCEIYQRNIRDKRLPCEACFPWAMSSGDVKTFRGRGSKLNAMFHRDICHRENQRHCDKRLLCEACFDLGDV